MSKIIISAVVALFCFACVNPAEEVSPSTNKNFPIELLFTHDGCSTYRFRDEGRHHYYVRCYGAATVETSQDVSCGKNCKREERIATVQDGGCK